MQRIWGWEKRLALLTALGVVATMLAMVAGKEGELVHRSTAAVEGGNRDRGMAHPVTSSALQGVVVEEVKAGTTLEKAGIRVGDVLTAWERSADPSEAPESQGKISSPFEWERLKIEEAPQGMVKLTGEREGAPISFTVELGLWDAKVRPRMLSYLLEGYARGQNRIQVGKIEEGRDYWYQVVERAEKMKAWRLSCWIFLRAGQVWARSRRWEEALEAYRRALEQARDPYSRVVIRDAIGVAQYQQSKWDSASDFYRSALEIRQEMRHTGLGVAKSKGLLGTVALARGHVEDAEELFRDALGIQALLAPDSVEIATTLNSLGILARTHGDIASAKDYQLRAIAICEKRAPESSVTAVILVNMGNIALKLSNLLEAGEYYRRALAIQERVFPDGIQVASTLNNIGIVARYRGDLTTAKELYNRALAIQFEHIPGSLELANTLSNLGEIAYSQGEITSANNYHAKALSIINELAPNSLRAASALNSLGSVSHLEGNLDLAEKYYRHALKIQETLAPMGSDTAITLDNLGIISFERGDLNQSDKCHQHALNIFEKLAPNSIYAAGTLSNLGANARERGDLVLAEFYYEKMLNTYDRLAPSGLEMAAGLVNLGFLLSDRGDLDRAEDYCQRSLSICRALARGSLQMVSALKCLGSLALKRDNLILAEKHFQHALEISGRMSSDSFEVAEVLGELGAVAKRRGQLNQAEDYYKRASSILTGAVPGSLRFAHSLLALGEIKWATGDSVQAEECYQNALKIFEEHSPDSLYEAEALQALGELSHRQGQIQRSGDFLDRAIAALESQIGKIGGSYGIQSDFRSQYRGVYHSATEVFLELKQPEKAFHAVERSRARGMLAMLAERDLAFGTDIPEGLDMARRRLATHYDLAQRRRLDLDTKGDHDGVGEIIHEMRDLRREWDDLEVEIRNSSRRLADLQYPQPMTAQQARDVLEPGTVMLSYSVNSDRTTLFAVTKKAIIQAETLPIGEERLRKEVDLFRRAITNANERRSPFFQSAIESGERLYELLISPAARVLERSERVLIVPDGPLHRLPFSALVCETGDFLAEWKPLHFVLSATLYGELQRMRLQHSSHHSSVQLAAFGDPRYPESLHGASPADIRDLRVRSAARRGLFEWEPLPYSRREVESISRLFNSQDRVFVYLSENATEERAKAIEKSTNILHFAVHGHLDDRSPLDSGLALTIPDGFPEGRENGLLQAWEIFERVRLDADLVVLSACQSALGQEHAGEGLIGLVRAFQYAGARTVAATLWNVDDQVTAELMVRFYRHLRSGKTKDVALQAAQIELIRGGLIEVENASGRRVAKDVSAPYFWAGLQIIGDWR